MQKITTTTEIAQQEFMLVLDNLPAKTTETSLQKLFRIISSGPCSEGVGTNGMKIGKTMIGRFMLFPRTPP